MHLPLSPAVGSVRDKRYTFTISLLRLGYKLMFIKKCFWGFKGHENWLEADAGPCVNVYVRIFILHKSGHGLFVYFQWVSHFILQSVICICLTQMTKYKKYT